MCIAIAPTAIFEASVCTLAVSMNPATHYSKPQFVVEQNKLLGFSLDKLFLQKLPESYFDYEAMEMEEKKLTKMTLQAMVKMEGKSSMIETPNWG